VNNRVRNKTCKREVNKQMAPWGISRILFWFWNNSRITGEMHGRSIKCGAAINALELSKIRSARMTVGTANTKRRDSAI
jgi:hypothetical protein